MGLRPRFPAILLAGIAAAGVMSFAGDGVAEDDREITPELIRELNRKLDAREADRRENPPRPKRAAPATPLPSRDGNAARRNSRNGMDRVADLNARLDVMAERRREAAAAGEETPWAVEGQSSREGARLGLAEVRFSSARGYLGLVWILRPSEAGRAVRVCLDEAGTETLMLPPGEYDLTLRAGTPRRGSVLLGPRRVELEAGELHVSAASADLEADLLARLRRAEEERSKEALSSGEEIERGGVRRESPRVRVEP